jgi:hypothetical protein
VETHPVPAFLALAIAIFMDFVAAIIPIAPSPSTTAVLGDSWTTRTSGFTLIRLACQSWK